MLAVMADPRNWDEVARLVTAAQGGDPDAFRELLQSHRAAVSSTLIACGVRSDETARDLAQEVALRAWRRLATLEDPRSFTAWVRRIAANAARDHLRRVAVRREEELEQALELAGDDDPHADAERRAELRLMLAALEEEDAEVVELLVARADGISVETLAVRVGLSEGALKMRLMRARKRLRERLEELRRSKR
jgi:RNA polymerase sigma-70 factor (ECF subfamily)